MNFNHILYYRNKLKGVFKMTNINIESIINQLTTCKTEFEGIELIKKLNKAQLIEIFAVLYESTTGTSSLSKQRIIELIIKMTIGIRVERAAFAETNLK